MWKRKTTDKRDGKMNDKETREMKKVVLVFKTIYNKLGLVNSICLAFFILCGLVKGWFLLTNYSLVQTVNEIAILFLAIAGGFTLIKLMIAGAKEGIIATKRA
jgi:hypothetical protein